MRARKFSGYNKRPKTYTDKEKSAFRAQTKKNLEEFYATYAQRTFDMLTGVKKSGTQTMSSLPYNPTTGTVFSGVNSFVLSQYMIDNGLSDARFCRFKQAYKMGKNCHVMAGGSSVRILEPVEYQIPVEGVSEELEEQGCSQEDQDAIFDEAEDGKIIFFKPISVFHASQIKNAPPLEESLQQDDWQNKELAERLVESCGINVVFGADKPSYALGTDTIHMPATRTFESPDHYAAALLRQWYVATGAPSREGRFQGPSRIGDGILNQAAEDMRAETFALMTSQTFGLPFELETQPIYVKCWEKQITENPKHVVNQVANATNLMNTIVEFAQNQQPRADWFPDKSTWPESAMMSDLDAQMELPASAEESEVIDRIQEVVASFDAGFAFSKGDEGNVLFSCDTRQDKEDGQPSEQDILKALEIREALQNQIDGLDVNVEDHDGTVVLKIDTDLSPDQEVSPQG